MESRRYHLKPYLSVGILAWLVWLALPTTAISECVNGNTLCAYTDRTQGDSSDWNYSWQDHYQVEVCVANEITCAFYGHSYSQEVRDSSGQQDSGYDEQAGVRGPVSAGILTTFHCTDWGGHPCPTDAGTSIAWACSAACAGAWQSPSDGYCAEVVAPVVVGGGGAGVCENGKAGVCYSSSACLQNCFLPILDNGVACAEQNAEELTGPPQGYVDFVNGVAQEAQGAVHSDAHFVECNVLGGPLCPGPL